ncbi:unnamed protein product [Leptosia nina]|uniref:Uncharacterized protein n=1 Tax=Leptosia nina TaxID=320188 RepID=A0AAV1ISI8_9NEOP
MRLALNFLLLTFAFSLVTGFGQFSGSRHPPRRHPSCQSNVTNDSALLKRVSAISKYIFTGKVHGVNTGNGTRVYKVNIRRVLKGDLNDVGVKVVFGKAPSLRFSDATVLVQSALHLECPPLRVRTYAIFLTERRRGGSPRVVRLKLVVEPVLLTLRNIEIIEAAVKGENYSSYIKYFKVSTYLGNEYYHIHELEDNQNISKSGELIYALTLRVIKVDDRVRFNLAARLQFLWENNTYSGDPE